MRQVKIASTNILTVEYEYESHDEMTEHMKKMKEEGWSIQQVMNNQLSVVYKQESKVGY